MVYKTGDELTGRESNNSMSDGCYNEEDDGIDKLGLIDEGRVVSLMSWQYLGLKPQKCISISYLALWSKSLLQYFIYLIQICTNL